ncbi:unnamed protein product [Rhizophagus irregularis]|nr:unnamed protein product [Rhizophagus irregularis]
MQDTEYTNEWINWIEETVDKEYLKLYEYKQFNNIQHIGTGKFGSVYRANWKNSETQFALKSFFNLDNITMKEIIRELKIQREVDFHNNIIRCYGITKLESENHNNCQLVMEYANGGTLRSYLKENFTDFGLSKRIEASSNFQSKLFGMVPYVDPKSFSRQGNNNNQSTQMYTLNEKSDNYSIGVLLWEISSGRPPFYVEDKQYDIDLALEISQGLRETIVPGTPNEYVKVYTKCWDGEPDNRPTIYQVVDWLNGMITKIDINHHQISNKEINEAYLSNNNSESQGDLSQLIQDFDRINIKEVDPMINE